MCNAEAPEREVIADGFKGDLEKDMNLLSRELRRAGLEAICTNEGVVALVLGLAGGVLLSPGIGVALGLAGDLLSYREKRRGVCDKHWTS